MKKSLSKFTYAGIAALAAVATTLGPLALYARKHHETLAEFIKNSAITGDIKAKLLADRDIPSTKISVYTVNGIVTLSGRAETHEQKQKALFIANQVNGVLSVLDNLMVERG